MTKKIIQDVVPPAKRKSIRDIPIPGNRRNANANSRRLSMEEDVVEVPKDPKPPLSFSNHSSHSPSLSDDIEIKHNNHNSHLEEDVDGQTKRVPKEIDAEFLDKPPKKHRNRNSGGLKKWPLISGIIGVVVIILLFLSFSGIEVTIYPKEVTTTINSELQAKNVSKGDSGPLGFTIMEVAEESSRTVNATGEEQITEKAFGKIVIYNEYTEEPQRLVKNTRFESPKGLIYRILESVIVPGLKKNSNGDVVPGSIEVEVFADEAGEKYNTAKTDFKVPGFKDLPQYDGFYARSSTEINGGFDGIKKIVSQSDRSSAEAELRKELEEKLKNSSKEGVGAGLLAFSDPSMQIYEVSDKESSGDKVVIGMKGISRVVILEASQLSNSLALASIGSFDIESESVLIRNINDLSIKVLANDSSTSPESLSVSVSGQVQFVWQTDLDNLAKSLAGTEIRNLKQQLEAFSSISKVEVSKKAFWKRNFPSNPDDINLVVEEEGQ